MIFNMTDTSGGGGGVTVESLSVTTNGTYTAPTGKAYSPVTVNVSGGGGSVEAKDVNFYDYDGTIVYSYTKADFLALNAMPSNPNHSTDTVPLTAEGWNWTLANAKTYVTAYGILDIGQVYRPTDNKTHIIITIPAGTPSAQTAMGIRLRASAANDTTINWGDGNTTTATNTNATLFAHTYAAPGTYDIAIDAATGYYYLANGSSSASYAIYGMYTSTSADLYKSPYIRHLRLGKAAYTVGYCFQYCSNLETVTVPNTMYNAALPTYMFRYCVKLKHLTIPDTITSMGSSLFHYCVDLASVSFSRGITSLEGSTFQYVTRVKRFTFPNTVTTINNSCIGGTKPDTVVLPSSITGSFPVFDAIYNLSKVIGLEGASPTQLTTSHFSNLYCLDEITIPSTVTSIGNYAFRYSFGFRRIYMKPTSPPTLGTNAFQGISASCRIIVPDASVATYKGASNWSAYSSQIIGESDV